MKMSAAQILRQAEELKASVQDTSRGANEAWISRQNLQDLYQKVLVLDLEYALDKKVEQDLWNHAFKNQINTLQTQSKDKQNPKRPEVLSSLHLFLETASGFYLQLLEELCSAFKLDLPCRRKASYFGILKEYGPVANKMKIPKKSSCMYICQHCLVHLGDIARYREQGDQAHTYYKHAANLVPYNGQPYNQLAILEAAKGNKLSTVVQYIRSIAVKHPFPVASTNLEKFYAKITRDNTETGRKLSMSELSVAFLQFNALIHLSSRLGQAKLLLQKILGSLPSHITSTSFSCHQLLQMVTVLLFTLSHSRRKLTHDDKNTTRSEPLAADEQKGYELCFSLTASFLDLFLYLTPKQEAKAKEYHTLPAIKVLLDWFRTDSELTKQANTTNPNICQNLSKLLNNLQYVPNQKDAPGDIISLEKYAAVPLPEDSELHCFVPLQQAHRDLEFGLSPVGGMKSELETRIRSQRLIEHGLWLCEEFPSLNIINVQKQKSGRLQFSAPTLQVKASAVGTDPPESSTERKSSTRQNVAIQAIMQNKAKKEVTGPETKEVPTPSVTKPTSKKRAKTPTKSDAGIMAHSATDTGEPKEKPIPADAWAIPDPPSSGQNNPSSYLDWAPKSGQIPFTAPSFPHERPPKAPWQQQQQHPTIPPPNMQPQNPTNRFFGPRPPQPDSENVSFPFPDRQGGNKPGFMGNVAETPSTRAEHDTMQDPAVLSFSRLPSKPQANIMALLQGAAPGFSHPKEANASQDPIQNFIQMQLLMQQNKQGIPPPPPRPQQPQHQPPMTDGDFEQQMQHLEKQVVHIAQQLHHVTQQIQQATTSMQQSQELQKLQQQLQQLKLQAKQTEPRQQPQLQQLISQHDQKILQLIHHYQQQLQPHYISQQQLQHQQHLIQQQQQQLTENFILQKQQQEREEKKQALEASQWPPSPAMDMDLSQMMAVMEMNKNRQANTSQPWGGIEPSPNPTEPKVSPISLSPGGGKAFPKPIQLHFGFESDDDLKTPDGSQAANDIYRQLFGQSSVSQASTDTTQSFLENLLAGSVGTQQVQSPDGAYIPRSDSEEELRKVGQQLADLSPFQNEEVPKPDSPPSSRSSMYSRASENELDGSSTYSLFSQSPWTVQLTAVDANKSHGSSPFGSSSSSVRSTPDPYTAKDDRPAHGANLGVGLGFGYNFGASPPAENWGVSAAPVVEDGTTNSNAAVPSNVQSLWSAGPSPLQKLLEQQKSHRQNDPH